MQINTPTTPTSGITPLEMTTSISPDTPPTTTNTTPPTTTNTTPPTTPSESNNLKEILELVKQFVMENAKVSIEPEEIEEAFRAVFPPKNQPKK